MQVTSAAAGVSIDGMPAGTDANARGATGDVSTLGTSASAEELLLQRGYQVPEKLKLKLVLGRQMVMTMLSVSMQRVVCAKNRGME
jgi:hypothetical protein